MQRSLGLAARLLDLHTSLRVVIARWVCVLDRRWRELTEHVAVSAKVSKDGPAQIDHPRVEYINCQSAQLFNPDIGPMLPLRIHLEALQI